MASGLSCDCGGRGGYFDLGSEGRGFERIIMQVCVWRMRVCKLREMPGRKPSEVGGSNLKCTRAKCRRTWDAMDKQTLMLVDCRLHEGRGHVLFFFFL